MSDHSKTDIQELIKQAYGGIARSASKEGEDSGCGCGCGTGASDISKLIGYSDEELLSAPKGANLGLGCGNPTGIAELKQGDVVLDLGSGAGFDCFLAANKVGPSGRVIGIDMTPEMIEKARENAAKYRTGNVEFRLGRIEELPVEDNSVDVVISNCVINLSADKTSVFRELYRVLRPGGHIAISDIAIKRELPASIRKNMDAWIGCVSGAIKAEEYSAAVQKAGLTDVVIEAKATSMCFDRDSLDPVGRAILDNLQGKESLDDLIASIYITARKKD